MKTEIKNCLYQRVGHRDGAKDATFRKRYRVWHSIRAYIFHLLSNLSHLGYATWLESRSLVSRISLSRSMIEGRQFLVIGAALEADTTQHLVESRRTSARNHDIQLLRETYPWATVVDLEFFLRGWNKGEEFAGQVYYTPHSYNERIVAKS
jgi:hypothetical protein